VKGVLFTQTWYSSSSAHNVWASLEARTGYGAATTATFFAPAAAPCARTILGP
jgi:hypothetical protein